MTSGGNTTMTPRDWLPMALVAAMPLGYALLTWDHAVSLDLTAMRQFGFPILLAALGIAILGLLQGGGIQALAKMVPPLAWAGVAIVLLFAYSSANFAEASPNYALTKTIANSVIVAFGLGLALLLSSRWRGSIEPFQRLLLTGFAAYLATVIAFILSAPPDFNWKFFGMTAQNIRNLGSHMMTVGAFAMGASLFWRGRWRMAAIAVAIVAVALLAWSGSRGSYFILLGASLASVVFLSRRQILSTLLVIVAIFVVGSALSLLHQVDHPAFGIDRILGIARQAAETGNVTSGRVAVWSMTIELLRDMPIWGYGDGQFFHIYEGPTPLAFPHNVILQLWFQWGWIGGTVAMLLLAWLGIAALKRAFAAPRTCLPAFLVLVTIGAYGMIDGPFYDTLPMLFFAIASALCLVSGRKDRQLEKA